VTTTSTTAAAAAPALEDVPAALLPRIVYFAFDHFQRIRNRFVLKS
jgi:hypothetical protein